MEGPGHGVLLTNTKRLPQRDASANYSDKDLVMPGNVIHNELRKQLDFLAHRMAQMTALYIVDSTLREICLQGR